MSEKKDHFFLGFTLGSTVAFAAALLLAPKTGIETQEKLKNLKQQAASKGKTYYDYAAETAENLKNGTSDRLSDFLDKTPDVDLGEKIASAKQPFDQVTSNIRSHFDAARSQLDDKTDKENYDDIVIDATDMTDHTEVADDAQTTQSAFQEAKAEEESAEVTPEATETTIDAETAQTESEPAAEDTDETTDQTQN